MAKAKDETKEDVPVVEKWTAERVLALLQVRHPRERGEWTFFAELRSHTGYNSPGRESYMDAFAMSCWPSSGFTRVAYEIKVARQDFLGELREPTKRAQALKLSNEMWFAAPTGIIRPGEVPEDCGWLEVTTAGLRVRKAAPYRNVEPPPMSFVASLLRWAGQARDAAGGSLSLTQAKAFKFAGRELTVDELLKAANTENERHTEIEVERRLRDEVKLKLPQTRQFQLARAVADAMGRRSVIVEWDIPSPDDFRMWLEGLQLGGLEPRAMQALLRGISYAREAADSLEQARKTIAPTPAERKGAQDG